MAGTWGPDGLKLYLDGELEGEADFKKGPTVFAETFQINNIELPNGATFPTNCVVDGLRLSDHQKASDQLILGNPTPVQPLAKLTTTWAQLKDVK
jgi:hypothetical protein